MRRFGLLAALALGLPAVSLEAADMPLSPAAVEFFESRVRPVLAENCYSCHGPKRQQAGLRLDSRVALLKGSDNGPVLVPGQPDQSLLLRVLKYDGDVKMPPKGKLAPEQLQALTDWVRFGAP